MLKTLTAVILLAGPAHAAGPTCVGLFETSSVISRASVQDLRSAYPLRAPARYAAKHDWTNYFEVSLSEISQAQLAMDFDLLRENRVFATLAGLPAEKLQLAGREVDVRSDGSQITFTWTTLLGTKDSLVVHEAPTILGPTTAAKAEAYMNQFAPLANSTEVYRAYWESKLAGRTNLVLGGHDVESLAGLRKMQSDLSLQRVLGLLPLRALPDLLKDLSDALIAQGSPHTWSSEKLEATSTGLVYNDQSMNLRITVDASSGRVGLVGRINDPLQPKTLAPRFEIEILGGVVTVVAGSETVAYAKTRLLFGFRSMFDEFVPAFMDSLSVSNATR